MVSKKFLLKEDSFYFHKDKRNRLLDDIDSNELIYNNLSKNNNNIIN